MSEGYAQSVIDELKVELDELQNERNAIEESYQFQLQRANKAEEELIQAKLKIVFLTAMLDKFEASIDAEDGL